ncbi:Mitogen-activated protein kinase kinase 3 [Orobanche minor]
MAGLEELKKKLVPLFDAEKGLPSGSTIDPSDSYMLSDNGTVNLLSKSYNIYNINELGLQKCSSSSSSVFCLDDSERTYRCASHEMRVFGSIGSGASSVVQRAIHIPNHRIIALKKINIFEKFIDSTMGLGANNDDIELIGTTPIAYHLKDRIHIVIDSRVYNDTILNRDSSKNWKLKLRNNGRKYELISDGGVLALLEKRQQLLTEIRTLCEAPCYQGLVQFYGAFYTPDSGQISIALEYVDGGSLADVLRVRKSIPEPIISAMVHKLLLGLNYLHGVRHLVHRDIKPANLLVNLKGEPKITDFGISAGLEDSMAMCATFVGTVTYMSPERIRNESYSYPADIWSLGLALFECATGEFPYSANEGPVNLMLQILDDPSPSLWNKNFSPEFCSFVDDCLQKDPISRPTAEKLLSHPFTTKYEDDVVNLEAFVQSIFDPTQRLKDLADAWPLDQMLTMLTMHYYLLFDGSDDLWHHMKTLYEEHSVFSFGGKESVGPDDIFSALSNIRGTLAGKRPSQKLVHVVEKLQCRAHGEDGVVIRVSGSFIVGNQFLICGEGVQVEGLPIFSDLAIDIPSKRVGTFREQLILETFGVIGRDVAGGFLKDDTGTWLWGFTKKIHNPTVDEREILALFHGLEMAWERCIPKFIVETDSESVYKWVVSEETREHAMQRVIDKIRDLIRRPWDIIC